MLFDGIHHLQIGFMIGQGSFALEVDPAIEVSDAAVFNILYFLDVRNSVEHHVAYEYH